MKKTLILSSCTALLLALAFVVGCDDNDHTKRNTTFEKMEFSFNYAVSADLLEVADLTFSYTDADGVTTTEEAPITASPWSKTLTATKIPAAFTVTVKAALKEGVELTKDRYVLDYAWTDEFKELRSDGKVHWHQKADTERDAVTVVRDAANPDALAAQLTAAIALMNRSFSYLVTADSDGSGYEVEDND